MAAGRRSLGSAAADAGDETLVGESGTEDSGSYGAAPPAPGAGGPAGVGQGRGGVYKFYFNIGSVDSFEHAMEEAQEELGVPSNR
jgi:AFG3 family protein